MQVAATHFAGTLSKQNQPHTIALHLEYVRRTEVGPATFRVRDVKLGRLTSTIHISLFQNGREEVLGYFIHANIALESGPTFDTRYTLDPPPAPASIPALTAGTDSHWAEQHAMPYASFRKATQNVRFFFPRRGQLHRKGGIADEWLALKHGEKFTNVSLGLVADMFPQLLEAFHGDSDPYAVEPQVGGAVQKKAMDASWYPTLLLNLDVKKALPDAGVDWLFVRVRTKKILNGRFDLEIIVLDEVGDIVALSHHVCMIVSAERNLAKRNTGDTEPKAEPRL